MFEAFRFLEPSYLLLQALPVLYMSVLLYRLLKRRRYIRLWNMQRITPLKERFSYSGKIKIYMAIALALAMVDLALAKPQSFVRVSVDQGVSYVVLLDGSASSQVDDVDPDRWQRSVEWTSKFVSKIRLKKGSIHGKDQIGIVLFANRSYSPVNITEDYYTTMFFLQGYSQMSPYSLRNPTTWDTNFEDPIRLSLNMYEAREDVLEVLGRPDNTSKVVILVSDGKPHSGEYVLAIDSLKAAGIQMHAVGVGTIAGGFVPTSEDYFEEKQFSKLERSELQNIARLAGGNYYEIGQLSDNEIITRILKDSADKITSTQSEMIYKDIYWWFLIGAAIFFGLALIWMRFDM